MWFGNRLQSTIPESNRHVTMTKHHCKILGKKATNHRCSNRLEERSELSHLSRPNPLPDACCNIYNVLFWQEVQLTEYHC